MFLQEEMGVCKDTPHNEPDIFLLRARDVENLLSRFVNYLQVRGGVKKELQWMSEQANRLKRAR